MRRTARHRLIEARKAAREGRRFYAFYCGAKDYRARRRANPYPPGSEDARNWQAGYEYAQAGMHEKKPAPVCRFGPGGDFVKDWPEGGQ